MQIFCWQACRIDINRRVGLFVQFCLPGPCRNQLQKCRGCLCLIVAEECTSTNQGTFWNLRRFTIIIPLAVTWKQLLAVWGNCTKENLIRLLRIQKRCARLVLNAKFSYNSVKLFTLGWLPIDDIIRSRKLGLLHISITQLVD